jgi:hypothetical protein
MSNDSYVLWHGSLLSDKSLQEKILSLPWYRGRSTMISITVLSDLVSTVNEVISKRFVKKQHMRWTKEGAHKLLQVRIHVLNDELRRIFCRWYPGMEEVPLVPEEEVAAWSSARN